jgi:hypothetical protein
VSKEEWWNDDSQQKIEDTGEQSAPVQVRETDVFKCIFLVA